MQLGICCSPLRYELADRLAKRLERNLGIKTVIVADESATLIESWEQASASDAVLLMLDRKSAPGPVKRDDWQSLLDHSDALPPVAILKLENCAYPKLLERSRRFFAPGGNELEVERWVERWLVSLISRGEVRRIVSAGASRGDAEWWAAVVDAPGRLALGWEEIGAVQTFACEAGPHFQQVFWIGCEGMPAQALTAEIEFRCATVERGLFVLVHASSNLAECVEGRHSIVILEGRPHGSAPSSIGAWIGACRASGFPGALLDSMLGSSRREEWLSLVTPLTVDHRWFRPVHGGAAPSEEACQRHFLALRDAFRNWRRQPESCRELVGEAAWAIERDRLASTELCFDLAKFLLDEGRMPEAVVWFRMLADSQDEYGVQAWEELKWLVDEFGAYRRPEPIVAGDQVTFDFPEFFKAQEAAAVDSERKLLEEVRAELEQAAAATSRPRGRQLQFDLFS